MLKVLGQIRSINVRKVLIACAELALPFEREDWGAGTRSTRDLVFLALNPNGLLPDTPRERARVEQWMDWQATDLNDAWRYSFIGLVRKNPAYQDAARIAQSIEDWSRQNSSLVRDADRATGIAGIG